MKSNPIRLLGLVLPVWLISMPFGWAAGENPTTAVVEPRASFEERHSDKAYIVLLSSEEITVREDWSFSRKIHRQFKIQKNEAKDIGEVQINYDQKLDEITDQSGATITPDGNRHPVVKAQNIVRYNGEPMYSDAMVRVLSMPAVGIGSVIDVSYTIESRGLAMKNAFWDIQFLRPKIPVKELRYTVTFPKKLGIRYLEFGLTSKPVIEEKDGMVTYRWVLSDVYDDEKEEKYAPPPLPDDPWEACEFSSIPSWEEFARWFNGLIEKNNHLTPEIEAAARGAVGDKTSVRDKVRAVLEYIQDNFRYVSMSFGENAFEPHPTEEVFRYKYGDCKDLSLLARAMLSAVGVKSHLALFNQETAITDPAHDLPIPNYFNHVLLLVEDPETGDFYADPLLKGYDIGQYPLSYQRAYTFVIDGDKGKFGRLPEFAVERSVFRGHVVVDISEDWSGTIEETRELDLDDSIGLRQRWEAMNEKERKEFLEQMEFSLAKGGEVMDRRIEGLEDRYGPVRTKIRYRSPEEFPSADGLIVINLNFMDRNEAFEKKQRKKAFFFPANKLVETEMIYHMPVGFDVLYIPPDIKIDGPYLSLTRTSTRTPQGVTVKESIRLKRVILPKEALGELRKFGEELSRQTRQRLVFKKVQ